MRPIKYTLLNKPELEYEIKLRLADPADTVVALKRQILGLIESNPDYVVDSPVPLAQDIAETSATLAFLEPKLTQITEGATRLIPKVETYLNHVFHRIERMDLDSDPSLQEDLKNLKLKFENLEKIFLTTLPSTTEQNPEQETDDQHTHEDTQNQHTQEEHTQEHHTHEEHDHDHYVEIFSTPQYSHTQTPAPLNQQLDKSLHELKKFNFSGKTCPRSFIQNIEEFRMSRRIDPHSLMTRIPDIFSDSALHWLRFKLNLNPNFTWKQLCTDLIKDFGGHDFDYKFLESIRNRTQGLSEPIIIYVSIMSGMFNRLSKPLTNDEKLEIIMRNIRPCYSNFIAHLNITTLEQLISACQQYEKVIDKNKTFKEPHHDPLAMEFNYKPVGPSTSSPSKNSFTNKSNSNTTYNTPKPPYTPQPLKPSYSRQINPINRRHSPNLFCVRCRINGHSLSTCTQPRFPICFKCGLKEFKTPECPKCRGNPPPKN
ncbi:hypothetical protein NE865_16437 [Phthorimaea operculella]|nr:hypothetical protein NE865_16437 [Phthorimaea operculella]